MSSSIYIGFALISPINNQKRYEAVINEILQYLSTHTQEVRIKVQPGRFLTIQTKNGTISDCMSLPLSPFFLHTTYFKLSSGFQIQESDKKFASICWEVLYILKENFPSKIHLHQDNLDQCKPIYQPLSQCEELRRQISCLISIRDENRALTIDELEDTWYTLEFSEKVQDVRSLNICLDLVNQLAPVSSLQSLKKEIDTLQRIINKNDFTQLSSNRSIAQELIDKIMNFQEEDQMNESLQRQMIDIQSVETMSVQSENSQLQTTNNIERPTSTRMCLFQLSESNDINRVTLILETLCMRSKETLQQMRKKYQLNTKLLSILKKYCNGDYGFDQLTSRKGSFQYNLVKLMIILSSDYAVFLEYLKTNALDLLSQIIEEAIIFAYEDSLSGNNQLNSSNKFNQELFKFLKIGLDFIELTIGKEFQEFVPTIKENLRKIQQRMIKLMSKKENSLLNYFYEQQNNQTENMQTNHIQNENQEQPEKALSLSIDQLCELKAICTELYEFAMDLNFRIQRIEALNDLCEQYEEKHLRLFYQILAHKQIDQNTRVDSISKTKITEKSNKMIKFQENLDDNSYNKNPQFNTYQTEKSDQNYIPDDNNFMKNKFEINNSYNQKQNLNRAALKVISNKENEQTHYISSPIKPYQNNCYKGRLNDSNDYMRNQF